MSWRKNSYKIYLGIMFVLLSCIAYADKSKQQFNIIYLNPYYLNTMNQNIWYNFTVNVNPPGGISSVVSAIIRFKALINPTRNFTINVNGVSCNTPWYYYSTTYGGAGQYDMSFDCSNVINSTGVYNVSLRVTGGNIGALNGWLELTYMDNPISMISAGTEYGVNDNARVFVRLLDGNSRPVNLAGCNATIFYPNNTRFISDQKMNFLESGVYYYDFITPNITGSYIVIFDCIFPSQLYNVNLTGPWEISSGNYVNIVFHFDNSNNLTINNAWIASYNSRNSQYSIEFNGVTIKTGAEHYLTNISLNQSNFIVSEEQYVKITSTSQTTTIQWILLYVNFTYNSPTQVIRGQDEIHISNYTVSISNLTVPYVESVGSVADANASWYDLRYAGATEYKSGELGNIAYQFIRVLGGNPQPINNGVCTLTSWYPNGTLWLNNVQMLYIQGSNGIYSINFTVPNSEGVYIVGVNCTVGTTKVYSSSTFHVSPWANLIENSTAEKVWSYAERKLTDYNQTEIISYLSSMNLSLHGLVPEIWSYWNRTLTDYNLTGVLDEMHAVNQSIFSKLYLIQDDLLSISTAVKDANSTLESIVSNVSSWIWSYSVRTLTDYNQSEIFEYLKSANESLEAQAEALESMPENVWNYNVRNLTYYPEVNLTEVIEAIESVPYYVWTYSNRVLTYYPSINITSISENVWSYYNRTLTDYNQTEILSILESINSLVNDLNTTLYNITIGNVSVNATVDAVEIALETLRQFCYYGAIDIYDEGVCMGPIYRGGRT